MSDTFEQNPTFQPTMFKVCSVPNQIEIDNLRLFLP
jgi:hypothetical protein